MRKTLFTYGPVYNLDQVKELNSTIRKNLISTSVDKPAEESVKTSEVQFIKKNLYLNQKLCLMNIKLKKIEN